MGGLTQRRPGSASRIQSFKTVVFTVEPTADCALTRQTSHDVLVSRQEGIAEVSLVEPTADCLLTRQNSHVCVSRQEATAEVSLMLNLPPTACSRDKILVMGEINCPQIG